MAAGDPTVLITAEDLAVVGSEAWWLHRCGRGLYNRYSRVDVLDRYYRGDPRLPEGASAGRAAYVKFQKKARTNYAELITEAVRQRMQPLGFLTGAAGDENGDRAAKEIWDENDLDVEAADVHRDMLALSVGYVIVGQDEDTGRPLITAEDPRQVFTIHDPRTPRRVLAGVKIYRDEEQWRDYAHLYLPGRVLVASKQARRTGGVLAGGFNAANWQWESDDALPAGMEKLVPVVRFANARGMGEFEPHLDHLDRINHTLLQRMVISVMQAFRQRAIKGDLPERDSDGNLIDYNTIFSADPAALWKLPEGLDVWESAQVDLSPILASVKDDVTQLAAVTQTPQHYLIPESGRSTGSAEGAQLSREGLVFKAEDRIARANVGWRQVMSLAFRVLGDDQRADLKSLKVLWAPAERLTLSERADAASKAVDMPWRTKMTFLWGMTPEQVEQAEVDRGSDAFLAAVAASGMQQGQQQPGQPQQGQMMAGAGKGASADQGDQGA